MFTHPAFDSLNAKYYLVGGAVRDHLINLPPNGDRDIIVIGLTLEEINERLKAYGTSNITGSSFNVIKFIPNGTDTEYDVAVSRSPCGTLEADLALRDFTINSIAMDTEGNIIDPLGGFNDIKNLIIRASHKDTFVHDPIRILRAVRFIRTLPGKWNFDPETLSLIKESVPKLFSVETASERFRKEITICSLRNGRCLAKKLLEAGVIKSIPPHSPIAAVPRILDFFDFFHHYGREFLPQLALTIEERKRSRCYSLIENARTSLWCGYGNGIKPLDIMKICTIYGSTEILKSMYTKYLIRNTPLVESFILERVPWNSNGVYEKLPEPKPTGKAVSQAIDTYMTELYKAYFEKPCDVWEITRDRKLHKNGEFYMHLDITKDVFEFISELHLSSERYLYRNVKKIGSDTYQNEYFTITFGSNLRYGNHDLVWVNDGMLIMAQEVYEIDLFDPPEVGINEVPIDEQAENYYCRLYFDVDLNVDVDTTVKYFEKVIKDRHPEVGDKLCFFILKNTHADKYHILTNLVLHTGVLQETVEFIEKSGEWGVDSVMSKGHIRSLRPPYCRKFSQGTLKCSSVGTYEPYRVYPGNTKTDQRDWYITARNSDFVIPIKDSDVLRIASKNPDRVKNLLKKVYNHSENFIELVYNGTVVKKIQAETMNFVWVDGVFHKYFTVKQNLIPIRTGETSTLCVVMKETTGGYSKFKDYKVIVGALPVVSSVVSDTDFTFGNRRAPLLQEHPEGDNFFMFKKDENDYYINVSGWYKL